MTTASQSATDTNTEPPPSGAGRRGSSRILRLLLGPSTDITLVLVAVVLVFAIADFSAFFSQQNITNIFITASLLIVMGTGATFVLITAGVDLSVGSVLVFSGVIAGMVMQKMGGQGLGTSVVGVVLSILAGGAWGLVNGFVITKMRVPPLIATLGSFGAAQGLAQVISHGNDYKNIPDTLVINLGFGRVAGIPWLVIVAVVVALVGGLVLSVTGFGRRTYAIGSNPEAARRTGMRVDRHLILVYIIAGLLAGLAGIMSFAEFGSTTISGHSTDNLSVIAAVVIGGTSLFGGSGTMFGTFVGTLIPAVLADGLVILGLNSFWRDFVVGVVLVLAVYLDQIRRRKRITR